MKKNITSRDIARIAGVSQATVSYVINEREGVAEETRKNVLKIVEELGYTPNHAARSMKTRRTQTVGVIVESITTSYYARPLEGLEMILTANGYNVLLFNNRYVRNVSDYDDLVLGNRVDGLILISSSRVGDDADILYLKEKDIPFVTINKGGNPELEIDSVLIDNYGGAKEAVSHLIKLGHRQIGFIGLFCVGQAVNESSVQRFQGYKAALEEAGCPFSEEWVRTPDEKTGTPVSVGYETGKELLTSKRRPTAIYTNNDNLACGVIRAALELGFRVPEDLEVIGNDNTVVSTLFIPTLSTVAPPLKQAGEVAAKLLIDKLESKVYNKPRVMTLPCNLIIRESSH